MKTIRLLFIITMLSGAVFIQACAPQFKPEKSCNFVQNSQGQRVSWKSDLPIQLYIHESYPVEYKAALESAIEQWEEAYKLDLFTIAGWTNGPLKPKQDSWNVIYWMTDWEDNRQFEQARTSIYWVGDRIREADIRVNNKDFRYFQSESDSEGKVHIESLMVHELGHVLGLGHNNVGHTVMAATLKNSTKREKVASVDLNSLQCEY